MQILLRSRKQQELQNTVFQTSAMRISITDVTGHMEQGLLLMAVKNTIPYVRMKAEVKIYLVFAQRVM